MECIGIDIGGTSVKAGRLDARGNPETTRQVPTPAGEPPEAMVAILADLVRDLAPAGYVEALPVGIGCAGLVDSRRGVIYTSPNLPGWTEETPLADLLEPVLGRRPAIHNDANVFVLAETRVGAGRGAGSVVGLTLGTGVGGGLVLGGRIWTGHNGAAGEIGHMTILADGPRCACGNHGCLEALIGTSAILDRYRALRAAEGAAAETVMPHEIARRAEADESAAIATWRETGRFLGLGLVSLTHLLDPELFVIGGGIAGAADLLLPDAVAALRNGAMLPERLLPGVRVATLGPDAGWIGAAYAAIDAESEG